MGMTWVVVVSDDIWDSLLSDTDDWNDECSELLRDELLVNEMNIIDTLDDEISIDVTLLVVTTITFV